MAGREAEVEAQRPHRRPVAHPEPGPVAETAEGEVVALAGDLPPVQEDGTAEVLGDGMPELDGGGGEGASADRVVVHQRADPAAAVATDGIDAAGVEPLEERDLLGAGKRIRGADTDARGSQEAPHQPLVYPTFADQAEESEVAAQDVPDRFDGRPRHPSPGGVEE